MSKVEVNEYDVSKFLQDVRAEATRAISLFPTSRHQLSALTEEAGEVAKAMNEFEEGKNDIGPKDIYKECVQAAAMCLRLAVHGDSTFRFRGVTAYHDPADTTGR